MTFGYRFITVRSWRHFIARRCKHWVRFDDHELGSIGLSARLCEPLITGPVADRKGETGGIKVMPHASVSLVLAQVRRLGQR